MNITNRILCVIFVLIFSLSLVACDKNKIDQTVDHGYVEGYYSELAYETQNEGTTTELIYLLCTDAELENAVGKKVVNFDKEGNMIKYTITMGVTKIERLTTYNKNGNGIYYSDIFFDENEKMTEAFWENVIVSPENSDVIKSTGTQEYFENGSVKIYHEEKYTNDVLTQTIDREFNEAGELVNETIK